MKICKAQECCKIIGIAGYCHMHYQRLRRYGSLELPLNKETRIDRIKKNIVINKDTLCWNWSGYLNPNGYGVLSWKNKKILAHRLSWIEHKGLIPPGFNVCHHCDNPRCINPEHLFLGTQKNNLNDMQRKGRKCILKGDDSPRSKLTSRKVLEIKKLLKSGASLKELSKKYMTPYSTISSIKNNYIWSHVIIETITSS